MAVDALCMTETAAQYQDSRTIQDVGFEEHGLVRG